MSPFWSHQHFIFCRNNWPVNSDESWKWRPVHADSFVDFIVENSLEGKKLFSKPQVFLSGPLEDALTVELEDGDSIQEGANRWGAITLSQSHLFEQVQPRGIDFE